MTMGNGSSEEVDLGFPKVELHCHLEGCFRIPTIIELAKKRHIALPSYDVDELTKIIKIDHPMGSLANYLSRFSIFMPAVTGSAEAIIRITREALEDKLSVNTRYIELRFSPHLLANIDVIPLVYAHNKGGISPREVIQTICQTVKQFQHENPGITVRLLLCTIVEHDAWSIEVAKFVEEFRNDGVVGIDIAGVEVGDYSKRVIEAYEYVKNIGMHRTAHAGEAGRAEKVEEAIDDLFSERIGHGYHVVKDERIYEKAKQSNVHFEVCPLSSRFTSSVSPDWSQHPALRFLRDEVNFSLSTDDPGLQCTNIINDYEVAAKEWKFSVETLKSLNLNGARSCFLTPQEKNDLVRSLENDYYK